jgi:peptidoglycan hydrolase-like protein with peptidoglycan-binding domain
MKTASYKALGNRASHGCIRLSVPDAKWIYDNVGAGTVVTITNSLPVDKELKEALKLPASPNDPHTPEPPAPEYSKDQKPDLKGATLYEGSRNDAVYWVQRRLKELGYYRTMCTGHMLNQTVQAIKVFQKDHGYYQSGSVNQQLIDAMAEAEKTTPTPELLPVPTLTPAP